MTTQYQTIIQKPHAIRWGSAKIEIKNDSNAFVDIGAAKSISTKSNVTDGMKYEPDNAPSVEFDATVDSIDIAFTMEEIWDAANWELLRGDSDTYSESATATTIGLHAGTADRPFRTIRLTNTSPGEEEVSIVFEKCKCTSQMDFSWPTDSDKATALGLPVTMRAYPNAAGFGTLVIPKTADDVSISPTTVTVAIGASQTITVAGAVATYGILNTSVASITPAGIITGVAAGTTYAIVVAGGREFRVPVTVTGGA